MTATSKNTRRAARHRNPDRTCHKISDLGIGDTADRMLGLGLPDFARHVGRIGVLAVSLGVGAAVAMGCGAAVASADSESPGSDTAATSDHSAAPDSPASASGQVSGTAAVGKRDKETSAAASPRTRRTVPDGTVRASGGAHTSSSSSQQDGNEVTASVDDGRDAQTTDTPSVERPDAKPGKHRRANDSAGSDQSPGPARHRRTAAKSSTTESTQRGETEAAPDVARPARGRHAASSDHLTAAENVGPDRQPADTPPQSEPDTALPAAADEPERVAVVVAAVLSPLMSTDPDTVPDSPVFWALLAASRRESQGAVLRRSSLRSADEVTASEPAAASGTRLMAAASASDAGIIDGDTSSAAVVDSAATPVRTSVDIDVLANDADAESLTLVDFTQPANGSAVTLDGRTITYTPGYTFHGTDEFTYSVSDAQGTVSTATVTVEVTNGDPVAVDDTASATADVPQTINLTDNDSDPEGQQLTVGVASEPAHGTVMNNYDGTVTYIAGNGFTGNDTFTYTITDEFGATATATVTVAVERNDRAPYAYNSDYATIRNATLRVPAQTGLLANDGDLDEDVITVQSVSQPEHGTLEFAADGSFTYTPDRAYTGTDGFDYVIVDATGATASASVTITVEPYNQAPVAVFDSASVSTDNPVATGNVIANDVDFDGDPLTATLVDKPTSGTVTMDTDGNFTYTANPGFVGSDTFKYQLSDGFDTSVGSVQIYVTAPNRAPTANDDTAFADAGYQTFIDVLGNDTDPDGDGLYITNVGESQHGTTAQARGGRIEYLADDDFGGTDTFTYEISDDYGNTSTATVTVTVKPKNQSPTAADDVATTTEGKPITIDVLANDSDPEGDPLTVEMYGGPDYGSVVVQKDGTIRFTPAPGFVGTDYFNYRINDGTDTYAYASVAVTVTEAEDDAVPVASDDRYAIRTNTTLRMDADRGVLANDTAVTGYRLYVDMLDGPRHGTLKLGIDGSFTYTPDTDFSGTDSFTYAAADGLRTSEPVTVTIDVTTPAAISVGQGGGADPGVCWGSWLPNGYLPSSRAVPSCMVDLPRRNTERD